MEKINIAELLKDCPKGMELDCALYDNVTLISVDDKEHTIFPIKVRLSDGCKITLTEYGQYTDMDDAKCIIFPKGKTTWEGFVPPCKFEDGDIIFIDAGCTWISIFQEKRNGRVATYVDYSVIGGNLYCDIEKNTVPLCMEDDILHQRLATEEEKQKLFDAIKAKGYKWNPETKTLEKLPEPKFKIGDRIIRQDSIVNSWIVSSVSSEYYGLKSPNSSECIGILLVSEQDEYELVPNKFDINTLKPFDKVLVRHNKDNKWCGSFFSHIDGNFHSHCYKYVTVAGKSYPMCIPYEGNEHLRGTTDDCDEYFKTW